MDTWNVHVYIEHRNLEIRKTLNDFLLHCHLLIHAEIYICMQDTYWHNDNRRRKTSLTIFTSHFIARVRKGCVGFCCERELETEQNRNILTPLLWPSALCLSRSPELLNRRPRAHSAGWWLSLLHLISIFSGPQLIRAPSPFGLVWLSLPHLVSNWLQLNWHLTSVLTAFYNSSTPTRSLKSNV